MGHWPHVKGSAVSRRQAPLEMCNNKRISASPLRRRATREVAHPPGTILPRLTVTEHRYFETLTFRGSQNIGLGFVRTYVHVVRQVAARLEAMHARGAVAPRW